MYNELGDDGKRRYTVAQIATEFGATRGENTFHSTSGLLKGFTHLGRFAGPGD